MAVLVLLAAPQAAAAQEDVPTCPPERPNAYRLIVDQEQVAYGRGTEWRVARDYAAPPGEEPLESLQVSSLDPARPIAGAYTLGRPPSQPPDDVYGGPLWLGPVHPFNAGEGPARIVASWIVRLEDGSRCRQAAERFVLPITPVRQTVKLDRSRRGLRVEENNLHACHLLGAGRIALEITGAQSLRYELADRCLPHGAQIGGLVSGRGDGPHLRLQESGPVSSVALRPDSRRTGTRRFRYVVRAGADVLREGYFWLRVRRIPSRTYYARRNPVRFSACRSSGIDGGASPGTVHRRNGKLLCRIPAYFMQWMLYRDPHGRSPAMPRRRAVAAAAQQATPTCSDDTPAAYQLQTPSRLPYGRSGWWSLRRAHPPGAAIPRTHVEVVRVEAADPARPISSPSEQPQPAEQHGGPFQLGGPVPPQRRGGGTIRVVAHWAVEHDGAWCRASTERLVQPIAGMRRSVVVSRRWGSLAIRQRDLRQMGCEKVSAAPVIVSVTGPQRGRFEFEDSCKADMAQPGGAGGPRGRTGGRFWRATAIDWDAVTISLNAIPRPGVYGPFRYTARAGGRVLASGRFWIRVKREPRHRIREGDEEFRDRCGAGGWRYPGPRPVILRSARGRYCVIPTTWERRMLHRSPH